MTNHFIDLNLLSASVLRTLLDQAALIKKTPDQFAASLQGKTLAMIFEKPSIRTRVSFEVGMKQLGGHAILLRGDEIGLGYRETVSDMARVLSRYVDCVMLRTGDHQKLLEFSDAATVPVINGLTDRSHPCQIMADIMTFEEHRGSIKGKTIAWSGAWNNVTQSWAQAALPLGFSLQVACPTKIETELPKNVTLFPGKPEDAVRNADCVVTDTWVSMSDTEDDTSALKHYQVNDTLMSLARPDALFMHCLPAHRDQEVTPSVIDGPNSVVFDEAENRMHAQKAVLAWCLS